MSFLKDVLGLSKNGPMEQTQNGIMVSTGEESTASNVVKHTSDDGQFLQFQSYFADIKPEIIDNDHIHQDIYFCALVKMGILQKRGNSYLPPESIYQQMKNSDGLKQVSFYRKKSNSSGTSFGFDYDSIGDFNKKHKVKLIDLLQEVETALDEAMDEAVEIAEMIKERHRLNPLKTGKISTHKKRNAIFNESKKEILLDKLSCVLTRGK